MTTSTPSPAPLYRRLLAMLYDGLLLLAILLIASAIPLIFTGGEAIEGHNLLLTGYFLLICFGFFGGFWTHGGQTLGMRVWRLQVVDDDGGALDWLAALLRFLSGLPAWLVLILGLVVYFNPQIALPGLLRGLQSLPHGSIALFGLLWLGFDNWPNGWRERITHTRVILLPRP
ncbi:RDD family protein [Thiohalophilus sp.]|uniref:RDD family protein n=1 Tax=Thiohalophilus sp. TaxID=3028392 RepID=UPI002ACF0373|nr:RDD family protein [Thiohalophilus sp.]MDZ7802867.1 RDD family protein [Thiohalophilus sp.]